MKAFCVANQKSGVGKSTTADALASYFARKRKERRLKKLLDYISDKRHPTPAGFYLMACTIIASLFQIDVRKIHFDTEIEPELAKFFREVAKETADRFFSRQ